MLYFKKDLIALAKQIADARKEKDDIKAFNELSHIEQIIQYYQFTGKYDPQYAALFDLKIRNDYPIIDELYNLPSNGSPQKDAVNTKKLPNELIALDTDRYGILISVLLKKEIISKLEDILEENKE